MSYSKRGREGGGGGQGASKSAHCGDRVMEKPKYLSTAKKFLQNIMKGEEKGREGGKEGKRGGGNAITWLSDRGRTLKKDTRNQEGPHPAPSNYLRKGERKRGGKRGGDGRIHCFRRRLGE